MIYQKTGELNKKSRGDRDGSTVGEDTKKVMQGGVNNLVNLR